MAMPSSLEIAQAAELRPVAELASDVGLEPGEVELHGSYRAKVDLGVLERLADAPDAQLVCVTAITPTKAGEGKTTTSVSLTSSRRPCAGWPRSALFIARRRRRPNSAG